MKTLSKKFETDKKNKKFLLIYKTYCDDYDTDIEIYESRKDAVEEMEKAIKNCFGNDVDFDKETDDAETLLKDCGKIGRFFMTDFEYIIEEMGCIK